MGSRATQSLGGSQDQSWAGRIGLGVAALLVLAAVVWAVRSFGGPAAPRRQVARITLLPDIPPPPPPPKEEKKPEPKQEQKQQIDAPKKETPPPPEPQQLKMEGPAGDAPSAFSAGDVKNEYSGGDIGGGDDRYRYAAYTSRIEQQIQEELTRRKLRDASGKVLLWLDAGGAVQRFKLLLSGGGAQTEQLLQTAFAELARVREAPPAGMPMPIGLDISVQ